MRKILMLLLCLCTLTVSAQDVIVKKDGNTVLCRIVEVGQTEVVYKRWKELKGNNYVMNISDITAINYENGQKKVFTEAQTDFQQPSVLDNRQLNVDDASLLLMAEKEYKIKRARRKVWVGVAMLAVGLPCLGVGAKDFYYEDKCDLLIPGAVLTAGGLAVTSFSLIKTKRLKKEQRYNVQSLPLWQNEFRLKDNSVLAPGLCAIRDNYFHTSVIGLGVNYKF